MYEANTVLRLSFSGSNLLIGTQKPEELKNTLKELKESGVIAINN